MIGVHLQEFRRELIPSPDITWQDLVLCPEFLQQDCHLLAVGCRPVVHFVHSFRLSVVSAASAGGLAGDIATGASPEKSPGFPGRVVRNACPARKTVIR